MKEIESKIFVGVRILIAIFIFILMAGIGSSRVSKALTPYMVRTIIAVFIAWFIASNYDKGKNWARIWMLIAGYGSIVLLIKDIGDFSKLTHYRRFSDWANFGIIIDVIAIIASAYVIYLVHTKKNAFEARKQGKISNTSSEKRGDS